MNKYETLVVLWFVALAEIPCLIRTVGMQVRNQSIWPVVWGTLGGSILALVIGLGLAKLLAMNLPETSLCAVERGSGLVLILIGLYMLFWHSH